MTAMRVPTDGRSPDTHVVTRRLTAVEREIAPAPRPVLHPARWFVVADLGFGFIAYGLTLVFRSEVAEAGEAVPLDSSWSMLVPLVITFLVFYALGLYERELLALRALHLLTLMKAMLWSAAISALVVYLLRLPIGFQSRVTVVGAFALFFVFAALVRTLVLPRVLSRRFREDMGKTLVVGWPYRTEPLRERLMMLKGFNRVVLVDAGREQKVATHVLRRLEERTDAGRATFGSVFITARRCTSCPIGFVPWRAGACSSICSRRRSCARTGCRERGAVLRPSGSSTCSCRLARCWRSHHSSRQSRSRSS